MPIRTTIGDGLVPQTMTDDLGIVQQDFETFD